MKKFINKVIERRSFVLIVVFLLFTYAAIRFLIIPYKSEMNNSWNKNVDKVVFEHIKYINDNKVELIKVYDKYLVFLSITDGSERAHVYHTLSETLEGGFLQLKEIAKEELGSTYNCKYVKVDTMYRHRMSSPTELKTYLSGNHSLGFSEGIMFDDDCNTVLLQDELNAIQAYMYDTFSFGTGNLNSYLQSMKEPRVDLDESVHLFSTVNTTLERDGSCFTREDIAGKPFDIPINVYSKSDIKNVIKDLADYNYNNLLENNTYRYQYNASDDSYANDYNMYRHLGATWSMLQCYSFLGDNKYLDAGKRAIRYVIPDYVSELDDCYYVKLEDGYSIGANGLLLLVLCEYVNITNTDDYNGLIQGLVNGIVKLQSEDGSLWQKLNNRFELSDKFIISYYDGEALLGLYKAYELLGDERILTVINNAISYFANTADNYWKNRDHWVQYVLNAMTEKTGNVDYYKYAKLNYEESDAVFVNSYTIGNAAAELAMQTFEIYQRGLESGVYEKGDIDVNSIATRVRRMLGFIMFSEYAMYLPKPDEVIGSCCVRYDDYRIRIDDIQHTIGALITYYDNLPELCNYIGVKCSN